MNFIEIKCPYECGKILTYERYYGHFDDCVNRIKSFNCLNCDSILKTVGSDKSILNDHSRLCRKSCNYCKLKFPLIDFDKHFKECTDRMVSYLERFVAWSKNNARNDKFKNMINLIQEISTANNIIFK